MLSRYLRRTPLILGAVVAALLFFVGGAVLRLMLGPISLGPFAGAIEDALNRSVSGLIIRFDQVVLEWSRADNNVNVIILGTKVFDVSGHIVAQAPKADLDFDALSLISGTLKLKRFALVETQLTAVRDNQGAIRLGFGSVEGSADLLRIIRESLESSDRGESSLETFSIRNARLAFRDDPTGLFIVSPNVSFTLTDVKGKFNMALDAAVEISGAPARLSARAVLGDDGALQHGTVDVRGLNPAAIAANSAKFAALKPYALKLDMTASFAMSSSGDLKAADFDLGGTGAIDAAFLKTSIPLERFTVSGRYNQAANNITLEKIEITGPQTSGTAKADVTLAWAEGAIASLGVALDASAVRFANPELFADSVALDKISVRATFDRATRTINWEQLDFSGAGLVADLAGTVVLADGMSPAIAVKGTVAPLSVKEVLRFWPLHVGGGARSWIVDNVSDGQLGPIAVNTDIPVGGFDLEALPENALSISFPFERFAAQYLKGLTLLTRAKGDALLTGDTFRARISEGSVGPLAVSLGDAVIPNLHVRGASGTFKARVEGKVSDVLTLIDLQPLGYATRFNLKPSVTVGRASLDLNFVVPMRRDLDVEDVGINIAAKVADLGLPIDAKRRLDNANASFTIDSKMLAADGTGNLSGTPISFKWTEEFAPPTPVSTRIDIQGRFDDAARAKLGVGTPNWITGPSQLVIALTGRRFHFDDANIRADLTTMSADYPLINFTKRPGVAASATASVHFEDHGGISVSNLVVTGNGLDVRGAIGFDAEGGMISAALPVVHTSPESDFALTLEAPVGTLPTWRIKGRSLDASRIFGTKNKEKKPAAATAVPSEPLFPNPIALDAKLDKVLMADNVPFRDLSLSFAFGANERLTALNLDAESSAGRVSGKLTESKGVRSVSIESDQAAEFMHAVTGFPSLRNGKLALRASFPADGTVGKPGDADYTGTLVLSDFSVMDTPFLARLFSLGSLDGPLRILQGQGIAFTKLEAPFSARGPRFNFREGRASGPAVGFTFQGMIDRDRNAIDLSGSLVPAYGINSVLGLVPLIGDLFVSKPGEGILGVTYRASGALNEPSLTVNPLSFLAPGILRRIFEFALPGTGPTIPEAVPPAKAPVTAKE